MSSNDYYGQGHGQSQGYGHDGAPQQGYGGYDQQHSQQQQQYGQPQHGQYGQGHSPYPQSQVRECAAGARAPTSLYSS